jgi:hypothetical protein
MNRKPVIDLMQYGSAQADDTSLRHPPVTGESSPESGVAKRTGCLLTCKMYVHTYLPYLLTYLWGQGALPFIVGTA